MVAWLDEPVVVCSAVSKGLKMENHWDDQMERYWADTTVCCSVDKLEVRLVHRWVVL